MKFLILISCCNSIIDRVDLLINAIIIFFSIVNDNCFRLRFCNYSNNNS